MDFAKLHGLGNDFLVVKVGDFEARQSTLASLARDLCERHTGIGADGVLFYQPTIRDVEAQVSALIFNADGSRAEMSGNGVRCLAAWLHCSGELRSLEIRIRTVSGVRVLTLLERKGRVYQFESSMGHPILDPARVPALLGARGKPLIDYELPVGKDVLKITVSSMGNPHCTTFWEDVSRAPVESLGPALERHSSFPNRTNVEFVQVVDRHRLKVRFWERGVGPTCASGTGSSAAAVAAILLRLAESPVALETEMGSLQVRWETPGELFLSGPAELICRGSCLEEAQEARIVRSGS